MNPINHFELNRPVHLARRDVYFGKAVKLISGQQPVHGEALNIQLYEHILFMLRIARQHAEFSIRKEGIAGHDEQFSHFINLLVGNVKAVLSMMNLKGMVENSQGSSFSFLGANQASAGLQAAVDVLQETELLVARRESEVGSRWEPAALFCAERWVGQD